jgi:hypothetical protein
MYALLLLLTTLPNLGFPSPAGVIPLRYIWFFFPFLFLVIKKELIILLVACTLFFIYPIIAVNFGRKISLYDVGMVAALVLCIFQLTIVYRKPKFYLKFVIVFFVLNAIYSLIQVLVIKIGLNPSIALLHQNSHYADYVIPNSSYFPYLPRYTGLFIESAPFAIYLIFSYLFFSINKMKVIFKGLALFLLLLSGSKSGLIFVFFILLYEIKAFKYINMKLVIFSFFSIVGVGYYFSEYILGFLKVSEYSLGSLYLRLNTMVSSFSNFFNDSQLLLFGEGVISTSSVIEGDAEMRGLDFFSFFVLSNGIFGSMILLYPIFLYIKKITTKLAVDEKGFIFMCSCIALMTAGSLANYQYTYLLSVLLVTDLNRKADAQY